MFLVTESFWKAGECNASQPALEAFVPEKKAQKAEVPAMSFEDHKYPKSLSGRKLRSPVASFCEEQPLKLEPESGFVALWFEGFGDAPLRLQPEPAQTGDDIQTPTAQKPAPAADMVTPTHRPSDLEDDAISSSSPSRATPTDADTPSQVDAVIEQLRQARLRRQRPH